MLKTTQKVKTLITQSEQLQLYLATSPLLNSSGKVWSGILTSRSKILARFNNHQVIRPLEAKAYLVLRTIYWLIENNYSQAFLFTDNSNIHHRFLKLAKRPLEKGYSVELQFRLTQRGKLPWPTYLWLARKLIAEHNLDLTLAYLAPFKNPATLITKTLKVCPKCQKLKKIAHLKRNCSDCWKAARKKQYERWLAWQKNRHA